MTQHRADHPRLPGRARRRAGALAVLLAVGAGGLAACGGGSDGDGAGDGTDAGGGLAATTTGGPRTVEVAMRDNAFDPARVEVQAGEAVRFVFTNEGATTHDAVVGDEAAQAAHEEEMRAAEPAGPGGTGGHGGGHEMGDADASATATTPADPEPAAGEGAASEPTEGTGGHGDEAAAITVEPGATGELTYTFAEGEAVLIGCHEPGHYAEGMRLDLAVTGA